VTGDPAEYDCFTRVC